MSRRKPKPQMLNVTPEEHRSILERVRPEQAKYLLEQDHSWIDQFMPKTLPENWTVHQRDPVYGLWAISRTELGVIMTGATELDGRRWLHVSCSRPQRIPNWDDLKLVKSLFLGDDSLAIQVFPPMDQWVNLNKFVLHLWSPVDDLGLPDFTRGTGSI